MGSRMPNGADTFHNLGGGAGRLGEQLICVFRDVDDLDRSNPTETLQKDAFLVHVVRKFSHLIGMRAGQGFDVMWLVDQRESPSNRPVIARQADKGFQDANNTLPMLWAIFA